MQLSSIILYAALHSGLPCEQVFTETARSASFQKRNAVEEDALKRLATAACQLSNPDIIWQIVLQESNFRFQIARENFSEGSFRLYEGQQAIDFLQTQNLGNRNIDIGAMQFNWAWHKEGFAYEPLRMLSPETQIDYFLSSYGGEIFQRCHGRWIGCYHNTGNRMRADRYEAAVLHKGKILRLYALGLLRRHRQALKPQLLSVLPSIVKGELDRVLIQSRMLPLPERLLPPERSLSRPSPLRPVKG